jgi:hypothetical protein
VAAAVSVALGLVSVAGADEPRQVLCAMGRLDRDAGDFSGACAQLRRATEIAARAYGARGVEVCERVGVVVRMPGCGVCWSPSTQLLG